MDYIIKTLSNLTKIHDSVLYNEEWRDIDGFEGMYQISSFGRVKGLKRVVLHSHSKTKTYEEKIMGISVCSNDYLFIRLSKDNITYNKLVHRLVGDAFIDNPDKLPEINHLFGNKKDNFFLNLEWTTGSKNMKHAYRVLGRKSHPSMQGKTGKLHPNSKGVYCPTLGISFESGRIAERMLGISQGTISDICNGKQLQRDGLTFKFLI